MAAWSLVYSGENGFIIDRDALDGDRTAKTPIEPSSGTTQADLIHKEIPPHNCTYQMRPIKALIYSFLGLMVAWGYFQRGQFGLGLFVVLFTLAIITLILAPIGRLRITWDEQGITLSTFPKKPDFIPWTDLEKISLDHLGYHITARSGRFKVRRNRMPEKLLERIKDQIRKNKRSS